VNIAGCPYCVVLADDNAAYRTLLKRILQSRPEMAVVGEFGDGSDLVARLPDLRPAPDLVLLDIGMPGQGGLETLPRIKSDFPALKVLVVSVHKQAEYLHRALAAGADGYVIKEDVDRELFPAIDRIKSGGLFVSERLVSERNGHSR